jgi:hypothetical protein
LRNDAFRREMREAQVRAQLKPLRAMQEAASKHWRAAAWLLERADPEQFDRRRNADCRPRQLHEIVEAMVQAAVDEVDDEPLRERLCRRLHSAAQFASRPLAATERARLHPDARPFDAPKAAEERQLDALLAEARRDYDLAMRRLKLNDHNPASFAAGRLAEILSKTNPDQRPTAQ